jgi:hypothetical protein
VAVILQKVPFFEDNRTLRIPNGPVIEILHHHLVFWASVSPDGLTELPSNAPHFPVVLDTAFNDNFLIQEQQLSSWAGIDWRNLVQVNSLTLYKDSDRERQVPLREADLWIHPNLPGFRDQFASIPPFRLELRSGIAVSDIPGTPRLPLFGTLALKRAKLRVLINGYRCHFSIHTVS